MYLAICYKRYSFCASAIEALASNFCQPLCHTRRSCFFSASLLEEEAHINDDESVHLDLETRAALTPLYFLNTKYKTFAKQPKNTTKSSKSMEDKMSKEAWTTLGASMKISQEFIL